MSIIKGVVYDPPSDEFPSLAVVFAPDGVVLVALPASSAESADEFLSEIMADVQAKLSDKRARK